MNMQSIGVTNTFAITSPSNNNRNVEVCNSKEIVIMYDQQSYTVNYMGLSVDQREIINQLRKNLQLKEICQNILYQRIIQKTACDLGLIVTPEEIQVEANLLWREKQLETEPDLLGWLSEQIITLEDWKAGMRDRLLAQKLAKFLFSNEVERFFIQHKSDFDQLLLYQLILPYEQLAWELFYQISEQEISFYEAAHLYDIDERRRDCCGYEGKIYRCNLKRELADPVFNARIGELIGPINTDQGSHLLMVDEFIPSELTATIRQDILNHMFIQWLECQFNRVLQCNNSSEF